VGEIHVHEFMSLDGVIDAPTWATTASTQRWERPSARSRNVPEAMLADGLVDELHLFVYPLTRGSGPRLFTEGAAPGRLSLAAADSYDNGVVYVAYRPQV
jgi:hypothetical protein